MNPLNSSHRPLRRPGTHVAFLMPFCGNHPLPQVPSLELSLVRGRGGAAALLSLLYTLRAHVMWLSLVAGGGLSISSRVPLSTCVNCTSVERRALHYASAAGTVATESRERERKLLVITPTTYQTLFTCQVLCGHLIQ